MKKHLFTIKMQPWCSARQHRARARGTEGGRGGVHLLPGPPAPLLSACPCRGWWAVTWRWGMAACAGPAAPPGGQPASSRPATRTRRGQARAAPPAGRHRGTHLMLSPEAAHGLLLLCQGHLHPAGDAWWGSVGWPPPAPEPPMAPRAVAWLVGTPTPMRKGGAAVLPRFQSCRGHWAIWRGAQPAPGHCPENRPPHAPDPQRRPWREPREGRGPLPWTALQVPVAGGPEDGQVTRKDGGRGPRGVATPHCCPRGATTPSAQHLLRPSRGPGARCRGGGATWTLTRRAPSGRGCWLENKRGRHRAPRGPRPGPAPTSHALPLAPPASPV